MEKTGKEESKSKEKWTYESEKGKLTYNRDISKNSIELMDAARRGNVKFLKERVAKDPKAYLHPDDINSKDNVLHRAARGKHTEFFKEALNILPLETLLILLSKGDINGSTPLHYVAYHECFNLELVESIVDFYKRLVQENYNDDKFIKPWLMHSELTKKTPLQVALNTEDFHGKSLQINEDSAMQILSLDIDIFCSSSSDYHGQSLLCFAIYSGLSRLAQMILTKSSSSSCNTSGINGYTPLHYAPRCSGEVLELLLKKHPEMISIPSSDEHGYYALHSWAMMATTFSTDALSKCPYSIRTKLFRDAICWTDNYGCNALHLAAANSNNNAEIARILIQGYQEVIAAAGNGKGKEIIEAAEVEPNNTNTPWRKQDNDGNTPLYYALASKNEDLASQILSLDPKLCDIYNNQGESLLYVAVDKGCDQLVTEILRKHHTHFKMLYRIIDGRTVLHNLHNLKEETGRTLLEKFWWIMNMRDDRTGSTALDEAKINKVSWLVNLLMNPSSLKKEPFDWIQASKNNETKAVCAFIDNCQDFRKICLEKMDTPLHHIKLQTYEQYLDLLKIQSIDEIKNIPNSKKETPLYRALVEEDINLAKALLRDIKVRRHKSAIKRLRKLYQEKNNWKEMCNQINVNPSLTTGYIQPETNIGDMRTTLSVVAALLATITFAAGFTLPGGLNSDTGDAILAKKAAFIVFLLADVYAMCTSMLVLLCLIWSMASTPVMSYVLVDRSVFILMQAVYGTMVAFMTGIYLVIAHKSLWTVIVVFIMCSFLVISASKKALLHVLIKLIPAANQEGEDIFQKLEEGTALNPKNKES